MENIPVSGSEDISTGIRGGIQGPVISDYAVVGRFLPALIGNGPDVFQHYRAISHTTKPFGTVVYADGHEIHALMAVGVTGKAIQFAIRYLHPYPTPWSPADVRRSGAPTHSNQELDGQPEQAI